jgi:thioredoxin-related protein
MRKVFAILLIVWASILIQRQGLFAQIKTYPFEKIDSLQNVQNKNAVVFIYTDWCKYCQTMKNTTFKNDSIIKLLNNKFYFINLNAEEKQNITFNNYTFKYKPTGINTGTHELANQLGTINNEISYPTICVLNTNKEIIFQHPNYINHLDLKKILLKLQ